MTYTYTCVACDTKTVERYAPWAPGDPTDPPVCADCNYQLLQERAVALLNARRTP